VFLAQWASSLTAMIFTRCSCDVTSMSQWYYVGVKLSVINIHTTSWWLYGNVTVMLQCIVQSGVLKTRLLTGYVQTMGFVCMYWYIKTILIAEVKGAIFTKALLKPSSTSSTFHSHSPTRAVAGPVEIDFESHETINLDYAPRSAGVKRRGLHALVILS
jgi:hypothetical protein